MSGGDPPDQPFLRLRLAMKARTLSGWLYRYPIRIRMMKLIVPTPAALR